MKEIFETRVCLAKTHSPDACNGAIIKAHTIPKSQLQKIATDGHVYAMRFTAADLARNDGALTAKKVGVGTFSSAQFLLRHTRQQRVQTRRG